MTTMTAREIAERIYKEFQLGEGDISLSQLACIVAATHVAECVEALEGFDVVYDWVVECGGQNKPLPKDVIHQFALLQIDARERAHKALALAKGGK